jgi:hypothetical protein
MMLCYYCLLAIGYILLLLFVSTVLFYSILLNTHISTNVFLLFGTRCHHKGWHPATVIQCYVTCEIDK